ncbi:MAG TPA: hypothetical protein VMX97_01515 [Hyphomicrobiaceae bacterium]|nr:hypothetical protein [Hyphomicrobiaceae bacterium]
MVFNEALAEYLTTGLEEALASSEPHPFPEPLSADRYVAMSALQKAIRRGNQPIGLSAALSLLRSSARGFWRRIGIIAFEDIGVANIDLVGWVTVAMGDARLRACLGGDWKVAAFLVEALCRSAKDRAVDDLLVMMIHDPALAERKAELADMDFEERLVEALSCNHGIEAQGIAAWFAMGSRKLSEGLATKIKGCPETYFDRLREAGYPGAAVEIGRMGWKRIGDGMPPVFPLLYRIARETEHVTRDDDLTSETLINGVPSCALDKHTRPGLAAYGRYLARSPRMNRLVRQHGGNRAEQFLIWKRSLLGL